MKKSLPKYYNNRLSRAVAEFNLLEEGDRIVIGLSGGKDSSFLAYAMSIFLEHSAIDFDICVVTVDMGIYKEKEFKIMRNFCNQLSLDYKVERLETESPLTAGKDMKSACAVCSHVRKGTLVNFMKREGYNKLALGHHLDDAVETFLMSIIYSGQITTFLPRHFLNRKKVEIIRPLVYLREKEINSFMNKLEQFRPVKCRCSFSRNTGRTKIKKQFREIFRDKQLFSNLVAAIREDSPFELWPESPEENKITDRIKYLWEGYS
ncbi:MAG: tRNA 2-thiocytidine biosynthesis TtcA family protein [Halanaerobiaceae bacterium]